MPPKVINLHEAKTHFSKLVDQVVAGEELIIGKAGKPLVKLVPYIPPPLEPRKGGQLAGQIWESPDCWDPDPELEALFYDGPIFPPEEDAPGLRVAEDSVKKGARP